MSERTAGPCFRCGQPAHSTLTVTEARPITRGGERVGFTLPRLLPVCRSCRLALKVESPHSRHVLQKAWERWNARRQTTLF